MTDQHDTAPTAKEAEASRAEWQDAMGEAQTRQQPWEPNALWDGDKSFFQGVHDLYILQAETKEILTAFDQLVTLGNLDPQLGRRQMYLDLPDRILIFAGLQTLGLVNPAVRKRIEPMLKLLEDLAKPSDEEDAQIQLATETLRTTVAADTKARMEEAGFEVYSREEFEEKLNDPDTDDESIKRLRAEQDAGLN